MACIDAGAGVIVHNHIDIVEGAAVAVADRYREGWDPVLAKHPEALVYDHQRRRRRGHPLRAHHAARGERRARGGHRRPGSVDWIAVRRT